MNQFNWNDLDPKTKEDVAEVIAEAAHEDQQLDYYIKTKSYVLTYKDVFPLKKEKSSK
tara:strand:+ start:3166 stop:3339 length:174 start_codon:yes stop_codon:yes gene_type:complete